MRLLYDRIAIEIIAEQQSSIITDSPIQKSKVLFIGEGKFGVHGTRIPMTVQVGDTITTQKNVGQKINHEEKTLYIINEGEIVIIND